jgi:hypothetical protein
MGLTDGISVVLKARIELGRGDHSVRSEGLGKVASCGETTEVRPWDRAREEEVTEALRPWLASKAPGLPTPAN